MNLGSKKSENFYNNLNLQIVFSYTMNIFEQHPSIFKILDNINRLYYLHSRLPRKKSLK